MSILSIDCGHPSNSYTVCWLILPRVQENIELDIEVRYMKSWMLKESYKRLIESITCLEGISLLQYKLLRPSNTGRGLKTSAWSD